MMHGTTNVKFISTWYVSPSRGPYNRITNVCKLHILYEKAFALKTAHILTKEFLNFWKFISNLIYTSQNYTQRKLKNILISSSHLITHLERADGQEAF
jgi:hypothetical protein